MLYLPNSEPQAVYHAKDATHMHETHAFSAARVSADICFTH